MDPRLKRTKFAAHSATLAEQFEAAIIDFPVGTHRLEMTVPEGSTGSGVQALQHIRLVPSEDETAKTYVVGNADRVKKIAELRSLEYVDQVSMQRFGARTGFDPNQYAACIGAAAKFLSTWGMTVTQMSAPVATGETAKKKGLSTLMIVMIVVWSVAAIAIGLVVGVIVMRGHAP